jgi:predicted O-methyltransferase YrrM
MEHFAETIDGFFDSSDFGFYRMAVAMSPQVAHFVEIGSYKGRSSSFLAVEIVRSNKKIKLDCVDTWEGSPEHQQGQSHEDSDVVNRQLFEVFRKNMQPVEGYYTAVRADSLAASAFYADQSLDFVFIDAAHDYQSVLADINAWLPKVKTGGIISGHDFFHDPVKQAVVETLNSPDTYGNCWYKIK